MKTFLFILPVIMNAPAMAQKAIIVDPHDFTRTPCEYRRAPCPGESPTPPVSTDNKIVETQQITVPLASGASVDATVSLVAISPRGRDTVIEQRVIVTYESLYRELRSEATRNAVYARLAPLARGYGVNRTDIAACRPRSAECEVSSFETEDVLADD